MIIFLSVFRIVCVRIETTCTGVLVHLFFSCLTDLTFDQRLLIKECLPKKEKCESVIEKWSGWCVCEIVPQALFPQNRPGGREFAARADLIMLVFEFDFEGKLLTYIGY